jgi:hypothetical protein
MSRPPLVAARLCLAVRVLVLTLLLVALFWVVAFLLVLVPAWLHGLPTTANGLLSRGAVCGLIAALFVAVFHIRREVIRLPVQRRATFVERLKLHLGELGYTGLEEGPDQLVFRPSFGSLLFGAGIRVELAATSATLTGPKVYLELLRRRLRLQSYLAPAERAERLLRRVELSMRLSPEQLPRLRHEIVGALRVAGAEVACQVIILARSEAGIRDAAVDEALQDWVKTPGVAVEVHKEQLALPRPLTALRPPIPARPCAEPRRLASLAASPPCL